MQHNTKLVLVKQVIESTHIPGSRAVHTMVINWAKRNTESKSNSEIQLTYIPFIFEATSPLTTAPQFLSPACSYMLFQLLGYSYQCPVNNISISFAWWSGSVTASSCISGVIFATVVERDNGRNNVLVIYVHNTYVASQTGQYWHG